MTRERDFFAPIKEEFLIAPAKTNDDAGRTEKKERGMNKKRKKGSDALRICNSAAHQKKCDRENCKFEHDLDLYMAQRGKDLSDYMRCPNYESCKFGLSCRFADSHIKNDSQSENNADMSFMDGNVTNSLSLDAIKIIRTKSTLKASAKFEKWYLEKVAADKEYFKSMQKAGTETKAEANANDVANDNEPKKDVFVRKELPILDIPERKKLDFRNKTFLAPLTTVGNLPFRRICKEYGVDVTCAEMALTGQLGAGNRSEWALLRRHKSEDFFGVQIAGSKAMDIAYAVESISQYTDADFIDLNLGCPVDLVVKAGGGSALLERKNRLGEVY
jgi:tRNA-dihydrouridine synthase 3